MASFTPHAPEIIRIGSYNLSFVKRLAEGGFGLIELVVDNLTKNDLVLKRCSLQRAEIFATVNKEIKLLQTFASPYVVKIITSEIQTKRALQEALVLLEFCPGGHLLDKVNNQNGVPFEKAEIYRIFGQLLLSLQPLHDYNPPCIHRDLKLENILIGNDENIRLCDFGSCTIGYTSLKTVDQKSQAEDIILKETTQMYRAPEMIDLYMRDLLTEKTDIWALGCIFYALCFLSHPFQDAGTLGILSAKINFPVRSTHISDPTKALILRMLDIDPEARPSIKEIFAYVRALAKDETVPELPLSEEAIYQKQRRKESELRREQKAQKKIKTPIVPARQGNTSIDPNSVAAKRLAMKKGGGSVSNPSTNSNNNNNISSAQSDYYPSTNSEDLFEANFDVNFDDLNIQDDNNIINNHQFSTSNSSRSNSINNAQVGLFSPSFDSSIFESQTEFDSKPFDAFGAPQSSSTTPLPPTPALVFDPFANPVIASNTFDAFNSPKFESKSETDPFNIPNQNNLDSFSNHSQTQSSKTLFTLFDKVEEVNTHEEKDLLFSSNETNNLVDFTEFESEPQVFSSPTGSRNNSLTFPHNKIDEIIGLSTNVPSSRNTSVTSSEQTKEVDIMDIFNTGITGISSSYTTTPSSLFHQTTSSHEQIDFLGSNDINMNVGGGGGGGGVQEPFFNTMNCPNDFLSNELSIKKESILDIFNSPPPPSSIPQSPVKVNTPAAKSQDSWDKLSKLVETANYSAAKPIPPSIKKIDNLSSANKSKKYDPFDNLNLNLK